MAVGDATGNTNVCAHCKLRNYFQRSNGTAIANATGNTPTCVPTVSSELSSEKQRRGHSNALGKHQCVCPLPPPKHNRKATAYVRSKCDEDPPTCESTCAPIYHQRSNGMALANALGTHQCVCPLQAPIYHQRSNGLAVANAMGAH
jgi:hypothetical protein